PPRAVLMDAGLAGRTVCLKVPDELRGEWLLKEDDTNPFVAEENGMRRPAWQATLTILRCGQRREGLPPAVQEHVDVPYWIPHWRLTQPDRNLKDELLERPLLSAFRFVRSRVLSYASASKIALVDSINLLLEPDSGFVCRVALRDYADRPRQIVDMPLEDVRSNHISQLEFLLGYCPRNQVAGNPSGFSWLWSTISFAGASDATVVRDRLAAAFQRRWPTVHSESR
ncbi:hypothetical protein PHMEG_00031221, partial [Phytophthora megakarya]